MDNITKAFHRLNVALRRAGLGVVCMLMLWCVSALEAKAAAPLAPLASADSTFTVASFRQLPTDVSAFIDAVRDLNGEACALLKVVAPSDFAFSSPLGIVKRRDEVGEIWLYLPKGTKSITLKHPQWGVLRNYSLGTKLESRMTYEMRLHLPQTAVVEKHDTIVYTQTVVDTVTVAPLRRIAQLHAYTLLTATMHTDGPSWGIMAAVMRRHGVYLHASSNLHSAKPALGTCNSDGYRDGTDSKPLLHGAHRNLRICPYAWRHTSSERLAEHIRRRRLRQSDYVMATCRQRRRRMAAQRRPEP